MYHGVKADSVPPFTRTPYGAHYCLGAFCSITQDSFFAPPRESQSFQPRSRLTLLARASDLDEKPHSFRCVCDLVCEGGKVGHACSQVAWMQFVSRARTQADPAATVTRSASFRWAIQGLSKEESRELDVARRGLGSQRGAGASHCLRLSIWDDGVGVKSIHRSAGCK